MLIGLDIFDTIIVEVSAPISLGEMPWRSFLLKSTLSDNLFKNFASDYQSFALIGQTDAPYVYVDNTGVIKLLTNVLGNENNHDGVFAISVAQDGWMEFLTF